MRSPSYVNNDGASFGDETEDEEEFDPVSGVPTLGYDDVVMAVIEANRPILSLNALLASSITAAVSVMIGQTVVG